MLLGARREHAAGMNRLVVDQHRTAAAITRFAASLGPGEAKLIAQQVQEQSGGLDCYFVKRAVDFNFQADFCHLHQTSRA